MWTQIEKTNLGNEFDAVQAWDAIGEGYVRFEAKEANRNRLGVVVENDATRNALCDGLIEEFEEEEEEKGGQESAKRKLFLLRGRCGRNGDDGVAVPSGKFKSSLGNSETKKVTKSEDNKRAIGCRRGWSERCNETICWRAVFWVRL